MDRLVAVLIKQVALYMYGMYQTSLYPKPTRYNLWCYILIKLGPSWLTYEYTLFYINLHVKYIRQSAENILS